MTFPVDLKNIAIGEFKRHSVFGTALWKDLFPLHKALLDMVHATTLHVFIFYFAFFPRLFGKIKIHNLCTLRGH